MTLSYTTFNCYHCDKEKTILTGQYKARLARATHLFCSQVCSRLNRSEANAKGHNPKAPVQHTVHTLADRWCIVCQTKFAPQRSTQIYCMRNNEDCWHTLKNALDRYPVEFGQAIMEQQQTCFVCHAPTEDRAAFLLSQSQVVAEFVYLKPLILRPSRMASGPVPGDIRAACTPCRKAYYVKLANQDPYGS